MRSVDFINEVGSGQGEIVSVHTNETVSSLKLPKLLFDMKCYESWRSEWCFLVAPGRVGSLATCPFIYVLEKVSMKCLESLVAKLTSRGRNVLGTLCNDDSLSARQIFPISMPWLVYRHAWLFARIHIAFVNCFLVQTYFSTKKCPEVGAGR